MGGKIEEKMAENGAAAGIRSYARFVALADAVVVLLARKNSHSWADDDDGGGGGGGGEGSGRRRSQS